MCRTRDIDGYEIDAQLSPNDAVSLMDERQNRVILSFQSRKAVRPTDADCFMTSD